MDSLIIEAKGEEPYIPEVKFDADSGICVLSGESYMEEPNKFYAPLIDWLKEYTQQYNKKLELNIKLIYFNTSTSKMLLIMMNIIRTFIDGGGEATVNWHYDPDDDDMKDEIEDYVIESGIEINKISMFD